MAYSVEQRAHEIGIRIALGAGPAGGRNMVVRQGGRLTTADVVLGLAAAFTLSRVMSSAAYGIASRCCAAGHSQHKRRLCSGACGAARRSDAGAAALELIS